MSVFSQIASFIGAQLKATNAAVALKAEQSALDAEITRAEGAEGALQAAINQEVTDRGTAVSGVQTALDGYKSSNDAALAAEVSRAEGAEAALGGRIDDLVSNVDPAALDSLTEVVTAFQNADSDLNQAITDVLGTHTSELAAEVSRAEGAEATLQANIDALATSGGDATSAVSDALDAEILRAKTAEGNLTGSAFNTTTQNDLTKAVNAVEARVTAIGTYEDFTAAFNAAIA